jgi:hypothetical protein
MDGRSTFALASAEAEVFGFSTLAITKPQ